MRERRIVEKRRPKVSVKIPDSKLETKVLLNKEPRVLKQRGQLRGHPLLEISSQE